LTDISNEKLIEFFVDTLERCGKHLLNASDEVLEYEIFQEFDIGAFTFLHEECLFKLKNEGFISEEIVQESKKLRELVMELQDGDEWNVQSFRTSFKWKKIMALSDEIKSML
jgi:hypothetical protein